MQEKPAREWESKLTKLAPGPFISRGGYIDYGRLTQHDRMVLMALDAMLATEYAEWPTDRLRVNPRAIRDLSQNRTAKIRGSDGKSEKRKLPAIPKQILALALRCTVEHIDKMLARVPEAPAKAEAVSIIDRRESEKRQESAPPAPSIKTRPWREEASALMITVGDETWSLLVWSEMLGVDDRSVKRLLRSHSRYTPEEFVRRAINKRRPKW